MLPVDRFFVNEIRPRRIIHVVPIDDVAEHDREIQIPPVPMTYCVSQPGKSLELPLALGFGVGILRVGHDGYGEAFVRVLRRPAVSVILRGPGRGRSPAESKNQRE